MTLMLGMISAYHTIQGVLIAAGVTLFVVVGVSLVAIQTKFDFGIVNESLIEATNS